MGTKRDRVKTQNEGRIVNNDRLVLTDVLMCYELFVHALIQVKFYVTFTSGEQFSIFLKVLPFSFRNSVHTPGRFQSRDTLVYAVYGYYNRSSINRKFKIHKDKESTEREKGKLRYLFPSYGQNKSHGVPFIF